MCLKWKSSFIYSLYYIHWVEIAIHNSWHWSLVLMLLNLLFRAAEIRNRVYAFNRFISHCRIRKKGNDWMNNSLFYIYILVYLYICTLYTSVRFTNKAFATTCRQNIQIAQIHFTAKNFFFFFNFDIGMIRILFWRSKKKNSLTDY